MAEAQKVKADCEEKYALKNPAPLSETSEFARAAIRHAPEKLKPFGATITEAVDFYGKFARSTKDKITNEEAMDLFRYDKSKQGLSASYISNSRRSFTVPFKHAFKNCLMNDVTPAQAHRSAMA